MIVVAARRRRRESSGLISQPSAPARRAGAEGWLIKPLDSLRLRRAATTIMGGGTIFEGLPADTPAVPVANTAANTAADTAAVPPAESPRGDEVPAG